MGLTVGTVTGQTIESYRGGDIVRMIQVLLLGDNPETVEWFDIAGEDTAPVKGDKVVVLELAQNYKIAIATKDMITAAVSAGERKFYSRNAAGAIQSTIYLKDDGTVEINGNVSTAVKYEQLNTVLQAFIVSLNATFATKADAAGAPGALALNLSTAQSPTVKIP